MTVVHDPHQVLGWCRSDTIRAHPTTSVANRFCVLFVKCGIFASYGQRYGKTGHPTNVANKICAPSYWWARYKSSRIIWRWFAGGLHFSIGRPYHCRLGRRLCASERFANRMCLQLCLNGGQTPKSGRSQSNTRCVDDRAGVSRCDIRRHVVASGPRFRARRRRRSLPGPVGGGARHGFCWWTSAATRDSGSAPPRLSSVIRGGGPPRGPVAWVGARPQCGRAAEHFGGVAPS